MRIAVGMLAFSLRVARKQDFDSVRSGTKPLQLKSRSSEAGEFGLLLGGRCFGDALGLAVDVGDGERPERNQVDTGDEFGEERGQEFPVPSQQVNHEGSDAEIEDAINGRAALPRSTRSKLKQKRRRRRRRTP